MNISIRPALFSSCLSFKLWQAASISYTSALRVIFFPLSPFSPGLNLLFVILSSSIIASPCVFLRSALSVPNCGVTVGHCSRSVSSGPEEACTVQVSDPRFCLSASQLRGPAWLGRHSCSVNDVCVVMIGCDRFLTIEVMFRNTWPFCFWQTVYSFCLLF